MFALCCEGLRPAEFTFQLLPLQTGFFGILPIFSGEVGQRYPVFVQLEIKELLPSDKNLRKTIMSIAADEHERMSTTQSPLLLTGGGVVTCDHVNVKETGAKFYDITLHYIQIKKAPHLLGSLNGL